MRQIQLFVSLHLSPTTFFLGGSFQRGWKSQTLPQPFLQLRLTIRQSDSLLGELRGTDQDVSPDEQQVCEQRLSTQCHALIPAYEYSCGGTWCLGQLETPCAIWLQTCLELHYPTQRPQATYAFECLKWNHCSKYTADCKSFAHTRIVKSHTSNFSYWLHVEMTTFWTWWIKQNILLKVVISFFLLFFF